jgi:hypothetical protein
MQKSWPHASGDAQRRLDAVADAARRWCDADFPARVRTAQAIAQRTGYSEPVVDYALDQLFEGLSRSALTAAIVAELGSLDALDGFVARPGRPDGFALPVGRVIVVASDTTIGVALPPAVYALCANCDVVVRDRFDALVHAFAATLAEEDSEVAARLQTLRAAAHDDPDWIAQLRTADAVVAFGGSEALRAQRVHLAPEARFIGFGHRTSATYVPREALADESCARALGAEVASDALLYDGEGCLSSHSLFVERGGALGIEAFAALVADACERAEIDFPPGRFTPPASMIAYRDAARFRTALGSGGVVYRGAYLLALEPPRNEPPPLLPRTLALYAVDGPQEFANFVAAHALPLEAVAVPALPPREDVAAAILASGAARFARTGQLQTPSFAGEHGGTQRIAPFVRWVTRDA